MSETSEPQPLDVRRGQRSLIGRLSLVWLVPLIALAVSLFVAFQNYANQGTEIEIYFENASGIKAEETEIRYRDVTVGRVEGVKFAEGLDVVIVTARIDQTVAPFLDADAQFWVVRPNVSVRGISGLDTVLSGVYIEGNWNTDPQVQQFEFVGLEEPPLTRAGQRGTEIVLRTTDGSSLTTGAPILHKGIQVGYLETPRLAFDGRTVTVSAFIESPYDRRITTNTRFWDTSGFSVSLGANGLDLDVSSIASLIEGGIAFDTVVSGGRAVRDGQIFDLFDDEQTARSSLFNDPDLPRLTMSVLFDGSVNGLAVGSEVRFQGIRIGEVIDLGAVAVDSDEGPMVQLRTVLAIEPGRLGLGEEATPDEALAFIADLVRQRSLRARLVTGNILSGALNVQLLEVPDSMANFVDLGGDPYPIIPTTDNAITDVADEAQSVLARINALPIEELMSGAVDLMDSVEQVVRSEGIRSAPDEVVALLQEARALVGSDDVQAIPAELRAIVADLDAIVSGAEQADLVARIGTVVDSAGTAMTNLETASAALPGLTEQVDALLQKTLALELEGLVTEATATLDGIEALIVSEGFTQAPAALTALIEEGRTLIASEDIAAMPAELRGVVTRLNGIITALDEADISAQLAAAVNSANNAAASIETASANLPGITAELESLAAKTNALELDTLVAEATATLNSINALVAADETRDLPASLASALDEMALFLADVREGGAVENVNAALASAADAARAIEEAAASLPALSARATALVAQTDAVVQSFGERSRFNAETLSTLRDIQEAADAVSALARAIQRNPNSLLTGR